MNLTDGCVIQTLHQQPDYAENNTIEKRIITGGTQLGREDNATHRDKITLVKLNSGNEFNIKWVTAWRSVMGAGAIVCCRLHGI